LNNMSNPSSAQSSGLMALKEEIHILLDRDDLKPVLHQLLKHSPHKLLGALYSALLSPNKRIRWHAVTVAGLTVSAVALEDLEQARIVMRRFMWTLNDESGGIGWGSPECMGEIMARHHGLAVEYSRILFSYLASREGGSDNFLEYLPLRRGAFWGTARLAQADPDTAKGAYPQIHKALEHETDPEVLAFICLYLLHTGQSITPWPGTKLGPQILEIYWDQRLQTIPVQSLCKD